MEEIKKMWAEYKAMFEEADTRMSKFTEKFNATAGKDVRSNIQSMAKLGKQIREAIQNEKNRLKESKDNSK